MIRVFVRGDVFTVHGERTKLIEEILKVSNFIKPGTANSTGMTYAMINLQQLRTVLQELVIVRGFKAEVLVEIDFFLFRTLMNCCDFENLLIR